MLFVWHLCDPWNASTWLDVTTVSWLIARRERRAADWESMVEVDCCSCCCCCCCCINETNVNGVVDPLLRLTSSSSVSSTLHWFTRRSDTSMSMLRWLRTLNIYVWKRYEWRSQLNRWCSRNALPQYIYALGFIKRLKRGWIVGGFNTYSWRPWSEMGTVYEII